MTTLIEEEYTALNSNIDVDSLDSTLLEKINMNIFFQNDNYKNFLEKGYFKNFSYQALKNLIKDLWNSEPLTKIIEKMAQDELETISKEDDPVILKERASKFYTANLLNLQKIKGIISKFQK